MVADEELRQKLVLIHQESLYEFQIEFKCGMDDKIGGKNKEVAL